MKILDDDDDGIHAVGLRNKRRALLGVPGFDLDRPPAPATREA